MDAKLVPANDVKVGDVLLSYDPDLRPIESIRETKTRRYVTIGGVEHPVPLQRIQRVMKVVSK
jgi:hypothetical protein